MAFSSEQLNFFKFFSVVLDVFQVALRKVFVFMWDTQVATSASGVPKWDDSVTVLNIFHTREGGVKKVPTLNKSYKDWDCTGLFQATLFAQTFAMRDGSGGLSTLAKLYVKPRGLSAGTFHPSVVSPTGNTAETYAFALDQLRLLRNTLCHQISTRKIDKATFDHYILLAKDAFTALGQDTTRIDDIGKLNEDDFPTAKLQQVEDELKREKDTAVKFKQLDDHLDKIKSQVEDVGKDVKTGVTDVKTQVEDVGSDVKDVKTEVTDVKTQVKDVGSDVKYVKTEVTAVKTQVEDVGSHVMELKSNVVDIKQAIQAENSKGPLVPDSCIPDKTPNFTGRQEECQAILNHFKDGITRLINVWGPPGFGKTTVAINVAHQLREMKIPVYFASLRGMTRKEDLVSKLLGIFANQAFYLKSPSDWLIRCLRQQRNPFALILDNADDLLESGDAKRKADVLRFIEEILGQCNPVNLLIATRESLEYLGHKLPIHQLRVGVLDEVSSRLLVKSRLPDVSDDDCSSIVKVCGQVPLVMRLMCSTVTEEHVSVGELLEELKISTLLKTVDDESSSDDNRPMVIFNTCFKRLGARERDAVVSLKHFPGSFGVKEATAVANFKSDQTTRKMLRLLKRKSFITDCSDNFENCTIHSLFRSFIEETRKTDQEIEAVFNAAQHRFYEYNLSRFEEANERYLTGHSNEALAAFRSRRESIIASLINGAKDDELYEKVVEILSKAELFLYTVLGDEKVLFNTIYDSAVEEAKRRENVVDEHNLLAARSFGQWCWFSSEHQAWDHSLQAGFTNAADCPPKLRCYNGIYQILCGELDEGMSSLKSYVDGLSSSCDETVLKLLAYQVLANCHRKKQEDEMASHFENLYKRESRTTLTYEEELSQMSFRTLVDDGICIFVKAMLLALIEENINPDIDGLFNMAVAIATMVSRCHDGHGQLDPVNFIEETVQLLKQSDEKVCKNLEPLSSEDFDLLSSVRKQTYDIAKALIENSYSNIETDPPIIKAMICSFRTYFENTLKSHEMVPGIDFEDLARTYDKLGNLQHNLANDDSGAAVSYQQAIRVREKNNGDPVDIASSLTSIGCVYFKMNNKIEAEKAFQSALELMKNDHVETANIYNTLAENYLSSGNFTQALGARMNALTLREKHLGEDSLTAASINQVGFVYYMMGEYDFAKQEFQKAVDMYAKLGDKGINSATSCHNLAHMYYELGDDSDLELARPFSQQAVVMRQALLGQHVDTAASLHLEGCIHRKLGDNKSAAKAFQKASEMRSNLLRDHKDTALSYYCLADAQCKVGDFKGGLINFQKASRMRKTLLGDHPDTAESFFFLGRTHRKLGDTKSAIEAFKEESRIRSNLLANHEGTAPIKSYEDLALSYHRLGVAQYELGDLNEALEYSQKASRMRKEVLGDHPDTAESIELLNRVCDTLSAKSLNELDCD